MNVSEYTYLMNQPEAVLDKQTDVLEKIVQEFPYFQSARALYLKGLYAQNSFKYNYALKIAAAHTTDRGVLFDFITSDTFTTIQRNVSEHPISETDTIEVSKIEEIDDQPKLEVRENTIEHSIAASIKEAEPVSSMQTVDLPNQTISDADFFPKQFTHETLSAVLEEEVPQEEPANERTESANGTDITSQTINEQSIDGEIAEQKLEIGKPLPFAITEKHSFQEWLQLSQIKPIVREASPHIEEPAEESQVTAPDAAAKISETAQTSEVNFEKQKKNELINKFIETSPKIPQLKHDMPIPSTFYEPSKADNSMLMTETLARVYLEQKKYHKAIQAYEILILKYPEKSSFFADRILDIKNLQQNNT